MPATVFLIKDGRQEEIQDGDEFISQFTENGPVLAKLTPPALVSSHHSVVKYFYCNALLLIRCQLVPTVPGLPRIPVFDLQSNQSYTVEVINPGNHCFVKNDINIFQLLYLCLQC